MATASMPTAPADPTAGLDLSESLYEVIDGVVVEKPPMGAYEYELVFLLGREIDEFVRPAGLGRAITEMVFDFRPLVDRERRPDIAYISKERCPLSRRAPRTRSWKLVPDLAVEVVSPTNKADEVMEKIDEYFRVGVLRVWVIYPRQEKIYAYDAAESNRIYKRGEILTDEALIPGFRLDLNAFFGPAE